MQVDLKDSIVILDEAHNIEDFCRDAGSFTGAADDLIESRNNLEKLKADRIHPNSCDSLVSF